MRIRDFLLLGLLLLWLIVVVVYLVRRKKKGGCAGCGNCSSKDGCSTCKERNRT